jgi:SAM-dependent methyltransferase
MSSELVNATIEWDVGNWSRVLPFWETVICKLNRETAKILCLGERNGGVSLWFAVQGFHVICSDYNGPSETARMLHARFGVSEKIEYADISVFQIPYPNDFFDIVACKSVIGGLKLNYKDKLTRTLENQKFAIDEIRRVLRADGFFLGAENMAGSWVHQIGREILKGNKIGWRHLRMEEVKWLFKDFGKNDFKFYGFIGTYFKVALLDNTCAWLDSWFARLLPKRWLYICFITCKK